MQNLSLAQKHQQFDEFFMIKHALQVNMQIVDEDFVVPSAQNLIHHMPYAFQVASELANIESKSLRHLRGLSEHASELVELINLQSRKIDMMMSLILQRENSPSTNRQSEKFGGGGIVVLSPESISVGKHLELKLFIPEESAAIFCYAEVIACEQIEQTFQLSMIFSSIREQDQDLLVRASLHLQALNLRKLKQQKNEQI